MSGRYAHTARIHVVEHAEEAAQAHAESTARNRALDLIGSSSRKKNCRAPRLCGAQA